MQKTPLYKRCLPALALILALMLPLVSLAEVSKVVKGGALNMRAEPSLSAQVLRQYPTGTWMTVLEDMGEWSKVRVNGLEGYVMSKYLSDTSSDSTLYVRTNTGRGLNLRDLPSLEGNIITSFKPGTAVTVLLRGNGWYKVSVQGMTGYMASQYLSASQSSGGGTSTSGYPKTGVVNNPGANQVLLLRETASTDARVLGYYRNGTSVQLPAWRQNLRFAAAWERSMEGMYPGFTRPVLFSYRFYNQDLTTGSLLIEIGGHGNNLNEALYAGQLAAKGLAAALLGGA